MDKFYFVSQKSLVFCLIQKFEVGAVVDQCMFLTLFAIFFAVLAVVAFGVFYIGPVLFHGKTTFV